jgi:hypothetical protein
LIPVQQALRPSGRSIAEGKHEPKILSQHLRRQSGRALRLIAGAEDWCTEIKPRISLYIGAKIEAKEIP